MADPTRPAACRRRNAAAALFPALLFALAGCTTTPRDIAQEPAVETPAPAPAPASSVLAFAAWVADATPVELRALQPSLERAVRLSHDVTADIRLALVLHALPAPDADLPRARHLLAQFLARAGSPQHDDLRHLATLLLRAWREQARLAQVHDEDRARLADERAALKRERERRALAEKRLDALIKVERRVKRTSDPITEVKPVPR